MVNNIKFLKKLMILFFMSLFALAFGKDSDDFDVISDLSYPISEVESVRHDITQALYFLQQADHESDAYSRAVDMFEQANEKSLHQNEVTSDDYEFLQAMLDQINSLIETLEAENEHRAHLSEIHSDFKNKL